MRAHGDGRSSLSQTVYPKRREWTSSLSQIEGWQRIVQGKKWPKVKISLFLFYASWKPPITLDVSVDIVVIIATIDLHVRYRYSNYSNNLLSYTVYSLLKFWSRCIVINLIFCYSRGSSLIYLSVYVAVQWHQVIIVMDWLCRASCYSAHNVIPPTLPNSDLPIIKPPFYNILLYNAAYGGHYLWEMERERGEFGISSSGPKWV
jgi:hypothetical protein